MYNSFTGLIDVGKYALFIELDKDGVFVGNDNILEKCLLENHVVFIDKENFIQKEDLFKLIKVINKRNINIKIYINCYPYSKLTAKMENVKYNIIFDENVYMNTDKIKDNIVENFITFSSNFIFYANDSNMKSINELISKFLIPKKFVYLTTDIESIDFLRDNAIINKYNFCPDFRKMLWDYES